MNTEDTPQAPRWLRQVVMVVIVAAVTLGVVFAFPRNEAAKTSGCGPDGCSHETQSTEATASAASTLPAASDAGMTCPVTGATADGLVCPVMGNKIASVENAAGKSVYQGKTYYFCCGGCKPKFDKDPAKYVKKT